MATTAIQRLRADVGLDPDDTASLSNADAQDLLDEAAESYDSAAASAYARVLALRRMLAAASRLVDYTQNESSEKQGQIFKNLQDLLVFWEGETAKAQSGAGVSAVGLFTVAHGCRGR